MKAKRILPIMALCFCVLFGALFSAQPADAQIINLTLYYDWEQDGSFSNTSLALNTSNLTFITGGGHTGSWSMIGAVIALFFESGRWPIYSGPWYGFMDTRDSLPTLGPGWFYIGPPLATQSLEKPGDIGSDGTPN